MKYMHVALGSCFSSPTLSVHGTELWFDDKGLHSLSCPTSPEIIYDVMKSILKLRLLPHVNVLSSNF